MTSDKPKKIIYLEKILCLMAEAILWKYKPKVVGITGSVGKSSAKEAVFVVLSKKFRVRKNEKNYNNEIGLPLTIIGAESGERSPLVWAWVFLKWLAVFIFPIKYPEILVLEMGADRPGDIQYLTSFIKPTIGIITSISESHLEFFGNLDGVLREKSILVKNMQEKGLAILNVDNEYLAKLKDQLKLRTLGFGFSEKAEMRAEGVNYNYENDFVSGLSFKLNYKGTNLPVRLKNILAKHQIYAALAGAAVGVEFGVNLVEIAEALQNFSSLPGRMNIFSGIKKSLIIDDSYNASPVSTEAALGVMSDLKASRKIVVLGDMLELGSETENSHRKIARKFLEIGGDIFIASGSCMNFAVEELLKRGFSKENIFHFKNSLEAAEFTPRIVKEGDLILVKGSQGARMEKVSEVLAENYSEAAKFIPRQDKKWRNRPVRGH